MPTSRKPRKRAETGAFDLRRALADWSRKARNPWKAAVPGMAELLGLHLRLRADIRRRYDRDLPFAEAVVDRWERARSLGFGAGASVYDSAVVLGDVRVGRETWIGPGCVLDGSGGLRIGRHCSISAGVQLYTHDTVEWALTGGKARTPHAPVRVSDCCYLGPYTVVAKGVTIGRQSIVGAHSFVNRDVPPRTFVAGCPARVLGRVAVKGSRVRILPVGARAE